MFSIPAKDKTPMMDSDTLSDSSSINLDSENEDVFVLPKVRTSDLDPCDNSFRTMVRSGV